MRHETENQAKQAFSEALMKRDDSWMGIVFRVENGRIVMDRTTWNFPTEFFLHAVGELKKNLEEEIRQASECPPDPNPLPRASSFLGGIDN